MTTEATIYKRQQLLDFVRLKLAPQPAVQGVVVVGSVAAGLARPGSDIDAYIFFDPLDLHIIPAESIWRMADDTFHSIFTEDDDLERDGLQLDAKRLDLSQWQDVSFGWSEPIRAELGNAWIAFDRTGEVARMIATHMAYDDALRLPRLDEAITWLDQHLGDDGPAQRWATLSPVIAHDRLHAAYDYLVQLLFATNRRWRVWRNREMTALLTLPWTPASFAERVLVALNAPALDEQGYMERAEVLQQLFAETMQHLIKEGTYGDDPISEAFIRQHEEPGRAWNMDAWMLEHRKRYGSIA
jgi:predicted nucleotidyltransferase